jgi:DNA-nicking Smr family endonuclease
MDFVGQAVRRDADEDGELFREAVRGARPLADRRRVAVPGRSAGAVPRPAARAATESKGGLQRDGASGHASSVSRKTVRDLAAGRLAPEATLDLHRRTAAAALDRLTRFLADSRASRARAVLVITGKAERSPGPGRLRDLVPDWLCGPLSGAVLAFTPARAEHGGAGALYVLLRASRP